MKKTILSVLLMLATVAVFAQQQIMSFEVKGDEKSYNQVRVVNETSYTNFHCRVVILNEDKSVKDYFVDNYDTDIKDQVVHDMRAPTLAFCDVEQLSRKLGTFRVFNATRGGKLEVFERVNFDEMIR